LRRAGIISFAVGVIMFLGGRYFSPAILFLPASLAPGDRLATDFASGAYLTVQVGGIIFAIAGAVMFFVSRRVESVVRA
jgi:hypothetical protein